MMTTLHVLAAIYISIGVLWFWSCSNSPTTKKALDQQVREDGHVFTFVVFVFAGLITAIGWPLWLIKAHNLTRRR